MGAGRAVEIPAAGRFDADKHVGRNDPRRARLGATRSIAGTELMRPGRRLRVRWSVRWQEQV